MRGWIGVMLLIVSAPLFAQQDAGSITGTLTDRRGRTIMNARIEIRDAAGDHVYVATTDRLGAYTLALPRGTYSMLIQIAGEKYTQDTVIIIPEHPLHHDVTFPLP